MKQAPATLPVPPDRGLLGSRVWVVADGYIPEESTVPPGSASKARELQSHEALCILNTAGNTAHIAIHVYYANRDPAGPYGIEVDARRTRHVRLNDLRDPEPIPRATEYSLVLESDVPVIVQHTRLDSRSSALALFSTVAYAAE